MMSVCDVYAFVGTYRVLSTCVCKYVDMFVCLRVHYTKQLTKVRSCIGSCLLDQISRAAT